MKRIFLVGVARSGTTLLQSIIGSHSDVYSFPESHFFRQSIPKRKILRLFHQIKDSNQIYIQEFLSNINKDKIYHKFEGNNRDMNDWSKYLISLYDSMCMSEGKSIWLEKTPMHLHFIDLIQKNCQQAHFIHIIREPVANIAGLYHASKTYPESFAQNTIEKALGRYIKEVKISQSYQNKANHSIVYYEELVKNPVSTIQLLCEEIGIEYQENMLEFSNTSKQVSFENEKWKAENTEKLQIKDKIKDRLEESELDFLKKKLNSQTLPILKYYENY